jgi:hypothetical protein
MPLNNKQIRERVTKMNSAWAQGAPAVTFKGITQAAFQAEIQGAAADDQAIDDMEAQLKMKRTARDERYRGINDKSINVRDGVEGHADFGPDHPLYEAMGFVRTSDRKSGLTRKKTEPPKTEPAKS